MDPANWVFAQFNQQLANIVFANFGGLGDGATREK